MTNERSEFASDWHVDLANYSPASRILSIHDARAMSGLSLAMARESIALDGQSYFTKEQSSESASHKLVRDKAITYFRSFGYHVYPEGVGVEGIFTLADFVAMRDGRVVFVEIMSDSSVRPDVIARKQQLLVHGEICFVVFVGNKRADAASLMSVKRSLAQKFDVLYCQLHGWGGNHIRWANNVSVAYDTTRAVGIRVKMAVTFLKRGAVLCAVTYQSRLYKPAIDTLSAGAYPEAHCCDQVYLEIFENLAESVGGLIKRRGTKVRVDAMCRPTGLKMITSANRELARIRSVRPRHPREADTNYIVSQSERRLQIPCGEFELRDRSHMPLLVEIMRAYPLAVEVNMQSKPET